MRVTRVQVQTFVIKIVNTHDVEATCDDCARHAARLVELMLSAAIDDVELLAVVHHLEECIPCAQEMRVLKECARMEQEDSWPSLEEMLQAVCQNSKDLM